MTLQHLRQSVARLKKRIADLEAFDPNSVALARGAEVRSLEASIRITIEQIFGADTPACDRFAGACYFGEGAGDNWRTLLRRNKERSIGILHDAVAYLEFEIADHDVSETPGENTAMRILFMAANPTTTTPLDLEEELRSLESELRGVKYRDQIILIARHAVRPDDLVRHVREERPTVIHFSGHGSAKGIVLRSDEGGYSEVTGPSLRRFLDGRGIELLVLNACHTKRQADDIAGVVSTIVGTTNAVDDEAARRFTVAFYRSLGNGLSIREAFRDGGDAVALHNLHDVFWSNGELDRILLGPSKT